MKVVRLLIAMTLFFTTNLFALDGFPDDFPAPPGPPTEIGLPGDCQAMPFFIGCPDFCKSFEMHPSCKPGFDFCQVSLDDVRCTNACAVFEFHRGCPKYCEDFPEDEVCGG